MHAPIAWDFFTVFGIVVIVSSATAAVGSVVGMLYQVHRWVDKKGEARAVKAQTEHDALRAELLERLSHQDGMLAALKEDIDDLKHKRHTHS